MCVCQYKYVRFIHKYIFVMMVIHHLLIRYILASIVYYVYLTYAM